MRVSTTGGGTGASFEWFPTELEDVGWKVLTCVHTIHTFSLRNR